MKFRNIHLLLLTLFCLQGTMACSKEKKQTKASYPEQLQNTLQNKNLDTATFAGGCFWCTEAVFERVIGVHDVVSGYAGGPEKNPTYKEVSAGKTGHAESIQIYYDPQEISFAELLNIFFGTHDPTTLNRQGPDVGKQYRSVVFYHNPKQKQQTDSIIHQLESNKTFKDPIVTQVKPFTEFYIAEEYHQNYYELNPSDPYVVSVAKPKIKKFMKNYPDKLKPKYRK